MPPFYKMSQSNTTLRGKASKHGHHTCILKHSLTFNLILRHLKEFEEGHGGVLGLFGKQLVQGGVGVHLRKFIGISSKISVQINNDIDDTICHYIQRIHSQPNASSLPMQIEASHLKL